LDFSKLNSDIESIFNPHISGNTYNVTKPDFNAGIKIPEINDSFSKKKAEKKTSANDGEFSLLELGKNIVKGTGQFFVDIYKNIINHPILSLGILAVAAAVASTPIGLMALGGAGILTTLFMTGMTAYKSGKLTKQGKWDELEKEGIQIGKLIPALIISTMSAMRGAKLLTKAAHKMSATRAATALKASMKPNLNQIISLNTNGTRAITASAIKAANARNAASFGTQIWTNLKKAFCVDNNLTGRLWRVIKIPFRAIKKPFLSKESRTNYNIFSLKDKQGRGLLKGFSDDISRNKLFTRSEKDYIASILNKSDPDRAKLFDWTFGIEKFKSIIPALRQRSE